jgi:hypothetical protein
MPLTGETWEGCKLELTNGFVLRKKEKWNKKDPLDFAAVPQPILDAHGSWEQPCTFLLVCKCPAASVYPKAQLSGGISMPLLVAGVPGCNQLDCTTRCWYLRLQTLLGMCVCVLGEGLLGWPWRQAAVPGPGPGNTLGYSRHAWVRNIRIGSCRTPHVMLSAGVRFHGQKPAVVVWGVFLWKFPQEQIFISSCRSSVYSLWQVSSRKDG